MTVQNSRDSTALVWAGPQLLDLVDALPRDIEDVPH
jgi:hypothetical protein